jgi:O-antigen/teichoic acid export membrane protein
LRALNLVSFPMLLVLVPLGTHVVTFFYGESWRPALFALNCFVMRGLCTNVTSTVVGYLNATERAATALKLVTAWTVLEVVLALAFLPLYGWEGVALAYGVGPVLPALWLLWFVHAEAPLNYVRVFGVPLLAGGCAAAVAMVASWEVTTLELLLAALLVSGGVALAVIAVCERALLRDILARVEERLKPAVEG